MAQDVLIVDDDRSALENFGIQVRLNLGIEPFLADNPSLALNILRDYPMKVLVSDHVFEKTAPGETGLRLIRKVQEDLKLTIPCIMLTGFPDYVDIEEITSLHLFGFVKKQNAVSQLPSMIREAIELYDTEQLNRTGSVVNLELASKRTLVKFGVNVSIRLLSISSVVDPYIREKDWETVAVAQRNISSTETESRSIKKTISYSVEQSRDSDFESKVGLNMGKLINAIEISTKNSNSFKEQIQYGGEATVEAARTIEVKEINDPPTQEGLVLQSREYQVAPIYVRFNCVLGIECNCCQILSRYNIAVNLPTNKFALRHVEHFSNGSENTIYTGFLPGHFLDAGKLIP